MEQIPIHYSAEDIQGVKFIRIHDKTLDSRISAFYKQEFVGMHAERQFQVVVDLSEVNFIDSSGLGALLFGRRIFTEDGGDLLVVGAHEKVMSMFKIAKLDRVFEFFEDKESAAKCFQAEA